MLIKYCTRTKSYYVYIAIGDETISLLASSRQDLQVAIQQVLAWQTAAAPTTSRTYNTTLPHSRSPT